MKRLALYFAALTLSLSLLPAYGATTTPSYDYLPQSEIAAITVGGQPSYALVRPWRGQFQYGAAILMADFDTHADPIGVIGYLRRHINDKGWASISLQAPSGAPLINHTTDADEISKPGEKQLELKADKALPKYSEAEWKKVREAQNNRLIQTMNQLDSLGQPYPGKRLLIASGKGAGLVISQLNAGTLPKPDILVIINPYLDHPDENLQLARLLSELDIPVLDIQSPDGPAESLTTARERKSLSPLNQPLKYEQQRLALNLDQPNAWQNTLVLIDGFARRINKAYP
ncbi:alpha/beta hydrolase family protein [Shewanella mesophila]|uniref:DUF3530 family protein n=1 Tax=Shewanella mesophila TaxID=2864208 RepID=UPI001C6613BB|nr:DUF3530 family protein [Shewanella mesophila]QYJ86561.1 alpha/beta hydrolase family protein [Shewanella mesophila]